MTVRRALVVDDSRLARQSLVRLLTKLDLEAVSVASGKEAVKQIKRGAADVVFVDYFMPEMDGYATAKAIAQDGHGKHLPLVLCTSLESDRQELQQLRDSGLFWGYVPKPPGEDSIAEALRLINERLPQQPGASATEPMAASTPTPASAEPPARTPTATATPSPGPRAPKKKAADADRRGPGPLGGMRGRRGKTAGRTIRRDPNNPQGVFASRLSHDDEVTR